MRGSGDASARRSGLYAGGEKGVSALGLRGCAGAWGMRACGTEGFSGVWKVPAGGGVNRV